MGARQPAARLRSDRDGAAQLFLYDFTANAETQLTRERAGEAAPRVRPTGRAGVHPGRQRAAPARPRGEAGARAGDGLPDAAAAAAALPGRPTASGSPTGLTWRGLHQRPCRPGRGGREPGGERRSPTSTQHRLVEPGRQVPALRHRPADRGRAEARVDLILRTPRFREDQFRDLFKDERRPERPARADARPGAEWSAVPPRWPPPRRGEREASRAGRDRLRRDPAAAEHAARWRRRQLPDDQPRRKSLLMIAAAAGQQNLYVYSLDELAREPAVARQLTSTPGPKSDAQFSPDGKEVYYLEQGRINVVPVETRQVRAHRGDGRAGRRFRAGEDGGLRPGVDLHARQLLRREVPRRRLGGRARDVRAAGRRRAHADEMRRLVNLMVGELNASHLGMSAAAAARRSRQAPAAGRLGLRFDRAEYERRAGCASPRSSRSGRRRSPDRSGRAIFARRWTARDRRARQPRRAAAAQGRAAASS